MYINEKIKIFEEQLQDFIKTRESLTQIISDLETLIIYCEEMRDCIHYRNRDPEERNS